MYRQVMHAETYCFHAQDAMNIVCANSGYNGYADADELYAVILILI